MLIVSSEVRLFDTPEHARAEVDLIQPYLVCVVALANQNKADAFPETFRNASLTDLTNTSSSLAARSFLVEEDVHNSLQAATARTFEHVISGSIGRAEYNVYVEGTLNDPDAEVISEYALKARARVLAGLSAPSSPPSPPTR